VSSISKCAFSFLQARISNCSRLWRLLACLGLVGAALNLHAQTIRVDITPDHVANTIIPNQALGAGIDRMSGAAIDKLFTEPAIQRVLSAGWQPVTYRQNTELHIEAWHWNPKGTWSDPSGKGYFIGSSEPGEMLRHTERRLALPLQAHV